MEAVGTLFYNFTVSLFRLLKMPAFSRRFSSQPHVQFSLRCELDIKSTRARVLTCIGACKVAEVLFNCSMYRHVCVVPRSSSRVTLGRSIIMLGVCWAIGSFLSSHSALNYGRSSIITHVNILTGLGTFRCACVLSRRLSSSLRDMRTVGQVILRVFRCGQCKYRFPYKIMGEYF